MQPKPTNEDIHPLQGFGQYAIFGALRPFPPTARQDGGKAPLAAGRNKPNTRISNTICVGHRTIWQQAVRWLLHTAVPTSITVCVLKGEKPQRRITRDRSNVPLKQMQLVSYFPEENFATFWSGIEALHLLQRRKKKNQTQTHEGSREDLCFGE